MATSMLGTFTFLQPSNRLLLGSIALGVAAILGLAACGAGDDEDGAPAGAPAQVFEISETDFALEPASVTIDEPGVYTFRAVNAGGVTHALEIEGPGIEEETESIGPGETAEVTVELEKGTYELYCPIGNHRGLGMEGSISVAGGGGSTGGGTTTSGDDDGSYRY